MRFHADLSTHCSFSGANVSASFSATHMHAGSTAVGGTAAVHATTNCSCSRRFSGCARCPCTAGQCVGALGTFLQQHSAACSVGCRLPAAGTQAVHRPQPDINPLCGAHSSGQILLFIPFFTCCARSQYEDCGCSEPSHVLSLLPVLEHDGNSNTF